MDQQSRPVPAVGPPPRPAGRRLYPWTGVLLLGLVVVAAGIYFQGAAKPPQITGIWSGPNAVLVLDDHGGHFYNEYCLSGSFTTSFDVAGSGQFTGTGAIQQSIPFPGATPAPALAVSYTGQISGQQMELVIAPLPNQVSHYSPTFAGPLGSRPEPTMCP